MNASKNKTHTHKKTSVSYQWGNPYVYWILIIRTLAAFSMFWFPWWGLIASLFFDYIDSFFLMQKAHYTREMYHLLDKWMDWLCYGIEFVIIFQIRSDLLMLFSVLLVWRFVGQITFIHRKSTRFFIIAPNFFEVFYMWLIAAPAEHITDGMEPSTYWTIGVVLLGVKIIQEVWLHAFWPWYLKTYGYPVFAKKIGYKNIGF